MEDYRYIGYYGRGHHKARCPGIGEIFYGQIISLNEEQITNLPEGDWVKVGNFCRHLDMDGNLCYNEKDEGSPYCSSHREEFRLRAQFDKNEESEQSSEVEDEQLEQSPEGD